MRDVSRAAGNGRGRSSEMERRKVWTLQDSGVNGLAKVGDDAKTFVQKWTSVARTQTRVCTSKSSRSRTLRSAVFPSTSTSPYDLLTTWHCQQCRVCHSSQYGRPRKIRHAANPQIHPQSIAKQTADGRVCDFYCRVGQYLVIETNNELI
jgi:hypothetical protein